jgi:type IV secretion system protein VirB6
MFLIALSDIALSVLLALGPLFIAMLLFDATRRMFTAWLAQLANYALITVLTVMVAALLLQVVQSYAAQTAARGSAIFTVDALNMMLVSVLVLLILRQIMPIAAGLAGGLALSTMGTTSSALRWSALSSPRLAWRAMVFSAPQIRRGVAYLKTAPRRMIDYSRRSRTGAGSDVDPSIGG